MKRRGFLGAILALGMAPAIIKAEILMPVRTILKPKYSDFEILPLPHTGIPGALIEAMADRTRLIREMVRYGALSVSAGPFIEIRSYG